MNNRTIQEVSLVLGSGGARGMAHIGVIQEIEERGLSIASISGCSIGAVIGAVHARGRLPEFIEWVCALEKMDVVRLLDFTFGRNGLIKGERIIDVLRELIGEANIEELPIHFTAVATDLDRQREVWLSEGPVFDAVRASIAIPTVFTPQEIRGRRLVDGGLLNPVPIAPTLRDHTDATIAVNLAGALDRELADARDAERPRKRDRLHPKVAAWIDSLVEKFGGDDEEDEQWSDELGFQDVVGRSFDTMQNALTRIKLAASMPDLVVEVPRNACLTYEFYRAKDVIDIGRERARRALDGYLGPLGPGTMETDPDPKDENEPSES